MRLHILLFRRGVLRTLRQRSKRSYVVRSTRIKEPAGGILRRTQNFYLNRTLHIEDVRIILRSISNCATEIRIGRTAEVHFLVTTALVRKFSVLCFKGTAFGLEVSRFLAIIAHHRSPRLALVSHRVRPARETPFTMLLSITRTLYGVGFTCQSLNKFFPPSVFRQNGARCLGVLDCVADALHTVVTKVSQDGRRLLISKRAFSSSSIVIPCADSWEIMPS
jgi:hypothetical protein